MRREFEAWVRSTRIPIPTRLPDLDPEELERLVEATGRFEGPVRPEQRALSAELDRRAAEEDDA
jgi:hypothetical protein